MNFKYCKLLIQEDLNRFGINKGCFALIFKLITNASFMITFWLGIGTWLKGKRGIWKILYWIVFFIHKHNQYKTGIQIPIGTKVGGGLHFPHFGTIIIHESAIIGNNCTIFQGVTIGGMRGPKGGVPSIGNNNLLFSGAKIIGMVTTGNNVVVGAGAVVLKDLEDNSVAVGIPAKVISHDGAQKVNYYLRKI